MSTGTRAEREGRSRRRDESEWDSERSSDSPTRAQRQLRKPRRESGARKRSSRARDRFEIRVSADVLGDELPANGSIHDEEGTWHHAHVAGRQADEVALHDCTQAGREHGRGDELRRFTAGEAEVGIEGRSRVGHDARFGIKAVEEVLALRRCAQREEERPRQAVDRSARTAQVANEFAAERSPEVSQEHEESCSSSEFLAQSPAPEADALDRPVEEIGAHGFEDDVVHGHVVRLSGRPPTEQPLDREDFTGYAHSGGTDAAIGALNGAARRVRHPNGE